MRTAKTGRPPAGRDDLGNPVPVTSYPRLNVYVPPRVRETVDLLAAIQDATRAELIERMLDVYLVSLPAQTKKALEETRAARVAVRKGKR